jgi:adenylylsulfate kinase
VIWFYRLSSAGKTTPARQAVVHFRSAGRQVVVLDGDELRAGLCRGLDYTKDDRFENVRRAAQMAKLLSSQGIWVMVGLMTLLRCMRELAHEIVGESLITVQLRCDHAICAARDVKGLYRLAAAGRLAHFPGTDMVFEDPSDEELSLDTGQLSLEECLHQLVLRLTA